MGKFIDLTGQRFGRLVVLERVENRGKRVQWLCQCDCGNKTKTLTSYLRNGDTQSCGCYNSDVLHERFVDITGQKFGRWTVLKLDHMDEKYRSYWLCECECGTIRVVNGINLKHGGTFSCGCYSLERISERNSKHFEQQTLVGQKFGKLTVIERTDKRNNGQVVYKCLCDCGNETFARSSRLKDGSKQSCGCLISKGEEKISKILKENNIGFEPQKIFEDCKNSETNGYFRFDFYIENKYLIEYDGEQHFKKVSFGRENLETRQKYDEMKNQYCKEHGIPLIRIPYTHFDDLCLDDLCLETSKFVI